MSSAKQKELELAAAKAAEILKGKKTDTANMRGSALQPPPGSRLQATNAYGQKDPGAEVSRWQERKEAKANMYAMSTEHAPGLGIRRKDTRPGAGQGSQVCQKCLKAGHWTFECKNERVYIARPTRTQQLKHPKLQQKFLDPEELPPDAREAEAEQRADESKQGAKRDKKKREREESTTTSESGSSESESDGSDVSSSESERDRRRRRKRRGSGGKRRRRDTSSSEDEETDSEEDRRRRRKGRAKHDKKRADSDSEDPDDKDRKKRSVRRRKKDMSSSDESSDLSEKIQEVTSGVLLVLKVVKPSGTEI
ncbi:hypothetical protein KFL_000480160 [Klebsormidium nitens]|uniref:Zinc knuckle-domain-containing protein n=1 Tax=Klebsormidium nitens TaxID=105231 RepID=A0A1Y1HNF5_KLENI|nr:hypothetical protein KFL_000480160 [Klebsormidium nitens]|eukprot:GAQ80175.1 hypothetical protein KFL_000480160 [Klebsormidium nitens]